MKDVTVLCFCTCTFQIWHNFWYVVTDFVVSHFEDGLCSCCDEIILSWKLSRSRSLSNCRVKLVDQRTDNLTPICRWKHETLEMLSICGERNSEHFSFWSWSRTGTNQKWNEFEVAKKRLGRKSKRKRSGLLQCWLVSNVEWQRYVYSTETVHHVHMGPFCPSTLIPWG